MNLLHSVQDFYLSRQNQQYYYRQMKKACGGRTEWNKEIYNYICKKFTEEMGVRYMQAWEEKLLERQKENRELLRKMNHKMSIEEIADVLDMDVSEVKHIIEEQYDTED